MKYSIFCFFFFVFISVTSVYAASKKDFLRFDAEFSMASQKLHVPKLLLQAIARQESDFTPLMINIAGRDFRPKDEASALALIEKAQRDGVQYDIGLMQINRYWVQKWQIPPRLLLEPAANITIGALILSKETAKHGISWESIGHYHSHTKERARAYAEKIKGHLLWLLANR